MERLTKFDYENYRALKPKQDVVDKLGELEDVLEKYGIETTEELDGVLKPLIDNGELENWKSATFWKMQTERLKQELAELKQKAIVPKFERQSHIYGFAYGRIKPYVVIAYLDNTITLCEDAESNTFEFCNNDYLVKTREEAEQKLAEIGGKDE